MQKIPEGIRHYSLDEVAECCLSSVVAYPSETFITVYNDLINNLPPKEFHETPDAHWDSASSHWDKVWKNLKPITRKTVCQIAKL